MNGWNVAMARFAPGLATPHGYCLDWLRHDLVVGDRGQQRYSSSRTRDGRGQRRRGRHDHARAAPRDARAAADGRRAGLIIVASMAAFQPLPYLAPYGATKIFDLVYAEALAGELSRAPIDVLALCSGGTETAFMERAGLRRHVLARLDSPERVARADEVTNEAPPHVAIGSIVSIRPGSESVRFC